MDLVWLWGLEELLCWGRSPPPPPPPAVLSASYLEGSEEDGQELEILARFRIALLRSCLRLQHALKWLEQKTGYDTPARSTLILTSCRSVNARFGPGPNVL